jgi:NAD(P)-dependent dehydrogenase (short-subunit alcohol dehydrogenase family)
MAIDPRRQKARCAAGTCRFNGDGRIARPDEIAGTITYLLDPNSSFITGQVFAIDGGLSRVKGRA